MTYRVELETRARREFLELPRDIQRRLSGAIDDVTLNPRPPGAKKLTGQDGYRVRQSSYRMLYVVNDREKIARIYRIGHRREIYR